MKWIVLFGIVIVVLCIVKSSKSGTSSKTVEQFVQEVKQITAEKKHEIEKNSDKKCMGTKCQITIEDEWIVAKVDLFSKSPKQEKWLKTSIEHKQLLSAFLSDSTTQSELEKIRTIPLKMDL